MVKNKMNMIKFVILVVVLTFASWTIINAYAYAIDGSETVTNDYFSIKIPDSWAYTESFTPQSNNIIFGPTNGILLTLDKFSDMLLSQDKEKYSEKIQEGGLSARFNQDTGYRIKNAPLESYVRYAIDDYGIQNITSQHYTTVGKEKAVRIDANESAYYGNSNIVLYLLMHDKQPYQINYIANPKNYEKYLPEFEQMVKSFRFVGSPSSENENLSENETDERTNHFELQDFCIDPIYQNKGYGAKAIKIMEEKHKDIKIWTLSTFKFSLKNQHLYEKMGYVKIGQDKRGFQYEKNID